MNNAELESSFLNARNRLILLIVATVALVLFMYRDALLFMLDDWDSPEFGHGYFIPAISFYLIWQRRDELGALDLKGSWIGVAVLGLGSLIFLLGQLSAIYIIVQYAFLISLYGLIISLLGMKAFRIMLVPLLFLVLMIPFPDFLYQGLSQQLQLISSQIGVAVIRLFGISVFLEGNVIDLGTYKLQVVEACSGLKYLFSLISIGFICAYLYNDKLWKRIFIFLSTIPITIFMNSFRIGVTGVLVEHWGISHADGFLHEFEGLVIFGVAVIILLAEMALLARIGKPRKTLRDVFAIPQTDIKSTGGFKKLRESKPFISVIGITIAVAITMQLMENRKVQELPRKTFYNFADTIGKWQGKKTKLSANVLESLKVDDYIMSNYVSKEGKAINFYIAWYNSQKAGKSAHSPRSCMPGGGWQIAGLTTRTIDFKSNKIKPIQVNRVVIKRGELTQLVYYWFKQRSRIVTNEYLVKWYIFWDSLVSNRTDGALIRLTTLVKKSETIEDGDKRLQGFAEKALESISEYVPN